MHAATFADLSAQGYNRIPISKEVLADLDTPLSTYMKLAQQQPYSYLLESVQGGEKWGRYSIIGLPCQERLEVWGNTVKHLHGEQILSSQTVENPLTFIADFQRQYKVAPVTGLPRFTGGLVGYFGHDTLRYIFPKMATQAPQNDHLQVPDILLMLSEEVLVFDNLAGKLSLIIHADPSKPNALAKAQTRLEQLEEQLRTTQLDARWQGTGRTIQEADFQTSFAKADFKQAVRTIQQGIVAGELEQVVISQRMSLPFQATSLELYRSLRLLNPSPYMFHLDLANFKVVGSSPEILARLEDSEITVRPIAGTRKRGTTPEEDLQLEQELMADPKELAEHEMLIELGRQDLTPITEPESIKLTSRMIIERYSHVMHIVSNLVGQLKTGLTGLDVLKATFPAGTLSGAPKQRALEVIDQLEPVKRGVYGGAVGYLSWHGNMDTSIAIRTAVIKDGLLHMQAGAGVVAASKPEDEWEETLNKSRAMFKAVAMAEQGLDKL